MPSLTFNPFTNKFDYVGSGSGTSYIDGEVDDSSLLPVTLGTPAVGDVYLAKAGSGVWLINRRPAGLYRRTANNGNLDDWTYLSAFPEVQADSRFRIYNATDATKEVAFSASGITTGTTRTLTVPDASGTLQLTGHASAHATTGSDPITPASIGAQSLFSSSGVAWSSGDTSDKTITAGRALNITAGNYSGGNVSLFLPQTGNAAGDIIVISYSGSNNIAVKYTHPQAGALTLATMTAAGQRYRFINEAGDAYWSIDTVYTHTHTSTAISDSTTAGRTLLTASTVAAQRTALELGTSATKNVGAGSAEVAAGDHTHSGVYAAASHNHSATDITSGTLNNARVNFASPSAIGSTTPATGAFTTLSANNGTLTASAPVLALSQTWDNAAVVFTGLKVNVTNTASNANSLSLDMQTGGSSVFNIRVDGTVGGKLFAIGTGWVGNTLGNSGVWLVSGSELAWSNNSGTVYGTLDVKLARDGSDALAQRRTTNAQTFRLYNTYTSATNFERLNLRWASNDLIIDAEKGSGGGTLRGIKLGSAATSLLGFYGVAPVDQPATVADPVDGTTVDAEARTAIGAIIDRLQELGLIA